MDDGATIFLFALVFSLLNYAINKKFGERDKVKALNKEVKDYQKQLSDAMRAKDEKKLEELQKRDSEMMGKMKDAMMLPFKALLITFPIFIILFNYILPGLFPAFATQLPFDIHLNSLFALNVLHSATYGPKGFFIVCSIFWGLIVEVVASNWDKLRGVAK